MNTNSTSTIDLIGEITNALNLHRDLISDTSTSEIEISVDRQLLTTPHYWNAYKLNFSDNKYTVRLVAQPDKPAPFFSTLINHRIPSPAK